MITPLEIRNKEFEKKFRGYKEKQVDEFLDNIIKDYEEIYKENIELKDKIIGLSNQIKYYNTLEETLKETLIVAQTTADEVTSSARQKADNIVEEAEIERDKMIGIAREDVRNIKREYDYLKKEIFIFRTRYKSFIESQLMSLEEFYEEIEKNNNQSNNQYDNQIINELEEIKTENQEDTKKIEQ